MIIYANILTLSPDVGIRQEFITLTNICGLKCNIDSVQRLLQYSSPLALFLTETQISLYSDATHFQNTNHTSLLFQKQMPMFVHHSAAIYRVPNTDISNREF